MRLLRALGSGIGITVIVSLVFSALLWTLGGYVGFGEARPFDTLTGRLVGLGVLWLGALFVILLILLLGRGRDARLAEEITAPPPKAEEAPEDAAVAEEIADMRARLRSALARLRKSRAGRRHLYDMPWYVIIGPPGAGKTTAIVNSGLGFPLAEDLGREAVGGVGGTRSCDWWFTDEAVLVDTAGRYTTQDSDEGADNAAWLGFLALLRRHRPRQPINGAVVAISLSDLILQDETTRRSHAAAVRRRLAELREKLGVRFPVYVLFTKADLIAGFDAFFDGLTKDQREQVWGFTLPLAETPGGAPMERVAAELDALVERLNALLLERMQAETDPERRALIAGFPSQVASLRPVARDFLAETFTATRFEQVPMLRGVYFASGTQEGTPIDRLMMSMARAFGIGRQAMGSGRGEGKSFFLTGLFRDVIFPEAGLVAAEDHVERRYRLTRAAALAAALLVAVGVGALWVRSYLGNEGLLSDAQDRIALYQTQARDIPPGPVADTDLPLILPALGTLRDLAGTGDEPPPEELRWGLYKGGPVASQAAQSYRAALNTHLLPRLLLRLEDQMQVNVNDPDRLYEALKVYLMMGLIGPMDAGAVTAWMEEDWAHSYPGAEREALRADLARHLDALLSQPMQRVALNDDLVKQAQGVLTRLPLAERVYSAIVASPEAAALPAWRLTEVGGPAIARAMTRSSGAELNAGVEGIFTRAGFHGTFLPAALDVATRLRGESWVLGEAAGEQSEAALVRMSRDVLDLYYSDYAARYDQILGDVDVIPFESLAQAVEVVNVLATPSTSPIRAVLEGIARETRLTEDPTAPAASAEGGAAGVAAEAALAARLGLEQRVLLEAVAQLRKSAGQPTEPGAPVEARFDWLQDLTAGGEGQPSELDAVIGRLGEVYKELNRLNFAGGVAGPSTEPSTLAAFQQEAARLPGPLPRWAAQIGSGGSDIQADGTRAGINARYQSEVLPFCTQSTQGRYPFDRRSQSDVAIQDFSRLFAPSGLLDTFFQQNLAAIVDTSTRPWSWKQVNGADLGMSPAALAQFQNAAVIREAFFPTGSLGASFQVQPEALDPAAQAVVLEIDGQPVTYRHTDGQPRPAAVRWPGDVGIARVMMAPTKQGSESQLRRDGPWAFFRLLDAVEIRNTNAADRKRMIFNVGGRIAIFEMSSASVRNPFALPALAEFSCPESF